MDGNSGQTDKRRRQFIKTCGSLAASANLVPALAGAAQQPYEAFGKTLLVDEDGQPLNWQHLSPSKEWIFYYPYVSTPCFLLKLEKLANISESLETAEGKRYTWQGGSGPESSLVAYSAICAHKMSHPSPMISFIGYRSDLPGALQEQSEEIPENGVIQCCSEHSIYDPSRGATVLSGPAPQPLAAIDLEFDDGKLYAKGVWGGQMFRDFLDKFGMRVQLELELADVGQKAGDTTIVFDGEKFSRRRISCS